MNPIEQEIDALRAELAQVKNVHPQITSLYRLTAWQQRQRDLTARIEALEARLSPAGAR